MTGITSHQDEDLEKEKKDEEDKLIEALTLEILENNERHQRLTGMSEKSDYYLNEKRKRISDLTAIVKEEMAKLSANESLLSTISKELTLEKEKMDQYKNKMEPEIKSLEKILSEKQLEMEVARLHLRQMVIDEQKREKEKQQQATETSTDDFKNVLKDLRDRVNLKNPFEHDDNTQTDNDNNNNNNNNNSNSNIGNNSSKNSDEVTSEIDARARMVKSKTSFSLQENSGAAGTNTEVPESVVDDGKFEFDEGGMSRQKRVFRASSRNPHRLGGRNSPGLGRKLPTVSNDVPVGDEELKLVEKKPIQRNRSNSLK
eukprot:Awhi_evm1s136